MAEEFEGIDMTAFDELVDPILENEVEDKNTDPNEDIVDKKDKENDKSGEQDDPVEKVAGEDKGEEDDPDDEGAGKSSPSLYSSLAKVLSEEGLLPSYDPEKNQFKDKDEFIEAFRESIKTSEYADLTPLQKQYLDAIRAGVPDEEIKQDLKADQNLESITKEELESNEELRKQIIKASFLQKGYDEKKADKLTQRSFDIGADLDDALESFEDIKAFHQQEKQRKIQEAEKARLKAQKDNEESLKKLKETITSFTEIIPGFKISEKDKQKVYEQSVKPVAEYNGKPINAVMKAKLENPVDFESKLNYLFYITKGFQNFDVIKTKSKTKATKELEDLVRGNTFTPKGSESYENLDYDPYDSGFSKDIIDNIV